MVRSLYVARHGLRANALPPPTGIDGDPRLTDEGYLQAQELGQYLSNAEKLGDKITAVYSSPFYRCLQTATPVSELLGVPIFVERGLSEHYVPERPTKPVPWPAGRSLPIFPHISLEYRTQIDVSPEGESRDDLRSRLKKALSAIFEDANKRGHSTILIVTHAAVKITIAEILTENLPRSGTCSLDKLTSTRGSSSPMTWEMVYGGATHFLSGGEQMHWSFDMAVEAGSAADEASRSSTRAPPIGMGTSNVLPSNSYVHKHPDSNQVTGNSDRIEHSLSGDVDSEVTDAKNSLVKSDVSKHLVSLDMSGLSADDQPGSFDPEDMHFVNLDTDRPLVKIGNNIYEGEWQRMVGTEIYTTAHGDALGTSRNRIKLIKAEVETPQKDRRYLLDRLNTPHH